MNTHGLLRRERPEPLLHAIAQSQSRHTAAAEHIVGVLIVGRAAENDLAARYVRSPDERALLIGIVRPDQSGLLPGEQKTLAVRQVDQDRSGGEIPVRILGLGGTVIAVGHRRTRTSSGRASASTTPR